MLRSWRRYRIELGATLSLYTVTLIATNALAPQVGATSPWRVPLAAAPIVPAIGVFAAIYRGFSCLDELQRQIQLEAMSFAFVG